MDEFDHRAIAIRPYFHTAHLTLRALCVYLEEADAAVVLDELSSMASSSPEAERLLSFLREDLATLDEAETGTEGVLATFRLTPAADSEHAGFAKIDPAMDESRLQEGVFPLVRDILAALELTNAVWRFEFGAEGIREEQDFSAVRIDPKYDEEFDRLLAKAARFDVVSQDAQNALTVRKGVQSANGLKILLQGPPWIELMARLKAHRPANVETSSLSVLWNP